MKLTIETQWKGDMKFESDVLGHKIVMDAGTESGGQDGGARPKPLMLVALAGCTGMDVVSILKKMRVEYEGLSIAVEADAREDHPKYYEAMKVIYTFKGKDLPKEKIERAVKLSQDEYCGVSALYKKAIDLDYEIRYE